MIRSTRFFPFLAIAAVLILGWAAPAALQEGGGGPEPVVEVEQPPGAEADAPPVGEPEASSDAGAEEPSDGMIGDHQDEAGADEDGAEEPDPFAELPVRAIVVRGNRNVDVSRILDAIQATRVGEPLELDAIRRDLERIEELGLFSDVRAETVQVEGGLRIVFQVLENPVVTAVRVESEVVDAEELRALIRQREGDVLNLVEMNDDLDVIRDRVREDYGYDIRLARWEMSPDGVVELEFRLTKVNEVLVRGNAKTKDFVILREITVKPGEPLRWHDLTNSVFRLQRLGYFQDVVPYGEETGDPDYVNVIFEVEERLTGTALVGAGYSSEDGLLGYIEIAERNFLGRGQQASIRAQFAQKRTIYDLGFYEPYLFGSPNSFGFNVYRRSRDRSPIDGSPEFREIRTGGEVAFGRALTDTTRLSLAYRAENLNTEVLKEEDRDRFQEKRGRVRSVTLSANTDTTDHWLSPTRGHRWRLSTELGGGPFLGGDFAFTKYVGEYSRYFRVGSQGQAIALRGVGGWGVGNIRGAEEQFQIGGADTVRGYAANSMEGDRMLVFNAEYRFPLSESVQGVVFADAGEAWYSATGSKGLKTGYGVGARLDTPLGVLRLDFALGDEGSRLHFFFGPSF